MRIAIGIEYDGTAYNGWQRQKSGMGVQEVVERAIGEVADHEIELVCAGRTDTGVHATAQVAHFDANSERSARGWLLGANSNLPDDINLLWVHPVADDFHARFSATQPDISVPHSESVSAFGAVSSPRLVGARRT